MAALYDSVILVILVLVFIGFVWLQQEPPVAPVGRVAIQKEGFQSSGGSGSGSGSSTIPLPTRTLEMNAAKKIKCNLENVFAKLQCSAYLATNPNAPTVTSVAPASTVPVPSVTITGSINNLSNVATVSGGDLTGVLKPNDMIYFGYMLNMQGPFVVKSVTSTSITFTSKYVGANIYNSVLTYVSSTPPTASPTSTTPVVEISNGDEPKKEVYAFGASPALTLATAATACASFGGTVATYNQLVDAYNSGAHWCWFTLVKDDITGAARVAFPIQTGGTCIGKPAGIAETTGTSSGLACYGVKPPQGTTYSLPGVGILPILNFSNPYNPTATPNDSMIPTLYNSPNKIFGSVRAGTNYITTGNVVLPDTLNIGDTVYIQGNCNKYDTDNGDGTCTAYDCKIGETDMLKDNTCQQYKCRDKTGNQSDHINNNDGTCTVPNEYITCPTPDDIMGNLANRFAPTSYSYSDKYSDYNMYTINIGYMNLEQTKKFVEGQARRRNPSFINYNNCINTDIVKDSVQRIGNTTADEVCKDYYTNITYNATRTDAAKLLDERKPTYSMRLSNNLDIGWANSFVLQTNNTEDTTCKYDRIAIEHTKTQKYWGNVATGLGGWGEIPSGREPDSAESEEYYNVYGMKAGRSYKIPNIDLTIKFNLKNKSYIYDIIKTGTPSTTYPKLPTNPSYKYPKSLGPYYVAANPAIGKLVLKSKTAGDFDTNGKFKSISAGVWKVVTINVSSIAYGNGELYYIDAAKKNIFYLSSLADTTAKPVDVTGDINSKYGSNIYLFNININFRGVSDINNSITVIPSLTNNTITYVKTIKNNFNNAYFPYYRFVSSGWGVSNGIVNGGSSILQLISSKNITFALMQDIIMYNNNLNLSNDEATPPYVQPYNNWYTVGPNPGFTQLSFDGFNMTLMGIKADNSVWYADTNITTAPVWVQVIGTYTLEPNVIQDLGHAGINAGINARNAAAISAATAHFTNVSHSNGKCVGIGIDSKLYYLPTYKTTDGKQDITDGITSPTQVSFDGYAMSVAIVTANGVVYYRTVPDTAANKVSASFGLQNVTINKVAYDTTVTSGSSGSKISLNKKILGCSGGTYGPSCTPCPAGKSSSIGASDCTVCGINMFSHAGSPCYNCPANQYSTTPGATCTPCPANQQSISGQSCTACPARQTSVSGGGCSLCIGGTIGPDGSCSIMGYITSASAMSTNITTSIVEFSPASNTTWVSALTNRLPAGITNAIYTSTGIATITINTGWIGYGYINEYPNSRMYLDSSAYSGVDIQIRANTYFLVIIKIANLTYTANGNPIISGTPFPLMICPTGYCCNAGSYSAKYSDTCNTCSPNTYSSTGASSCTPCAANNTSAAGASSCNVCPNNQTSIGGQACTACPTGTISIGGQACTACPTGTIYVASSGICGIETCPTLSMMKSIPSNLPIAGYLFSSYVQPPPWIYSSVNNGKTCRICMAYLDNSCIGTFVNGISRNCFDVNGEGIVSNLGPTKCCFTSGCVPG